MAIHRYNCHLPSFIQFDSLSDFLCYNNVNVVADKKQHSTDMERKFCFTLLLIIDNSQKTFYIMYVLNAQKRIINANKRVYYEKITNACKR